MLWAIKPTCDLRQLFPMNCVRQQVEMLLRASWRGLGRKCEANVMLQRHQDSLAGASTTFE